MYISNYYVVTDCHYMHINGIIMDADDNDGTKVAVGFLCACLVIVIIAMTVVGPKLFCRRCNSKDSAEKEEYKDEDIFGEIRYPDEAHSKHIH